MAYTILGITIRSRGEKKVFGKDILLFNELHEAHHRKHWWRFWSFEDERQATRYAIGELIKRGYTFEQCLDMEVSYRLWEKYDLTLEQFKEYMSVKC